MLFVLVPIVRPYRKFNIPGRDTPIATGKVRWTKSAYMDDWLYLRSLLPEEQWKNVKFTIPAPSWTHTQVKDGHAYEKGVYASDEEYLQDVGEAVRQEVLALYGAGM
jgi:methionine synthase II (cobalamin-independent)